MLKGVILNILRSSLIEVDKKNSIFISNETQQYKPKALTLRLLYITDTTYLSTEEDSMYHIGRSRKCTQYSRCYSVNNQ